jgi:transcriptional regulator with XRE-family HTH domain
MSNSLTDQIREAVKNSGLSQQQICEQAGIDKGSLSRFVTGERGLSFSHLDKLAEVLGLRITTTKRKGG